MKYALKNSHFGKKVLVSIVQQRLLVLHNGKQKIQSAIKNIIVSPHTNNDVKSLKLKKKQLIHINIWNIAS